MPATIKLGLFSVNMYACADPQAIAYIAPLAEEAGFDSLWAGEHIVLPDPRVPPSPMEPRDPALDPLLALTFAAAHTTRIRLATGIIILPQRNPVVLAKQLASLDVLSGGRLIVGIGVGYLEPEMTAIGVPMAGRGERSDAYLAAMRALWSMDKPSYRGDYVSFEQVNAYPRPVQQPGPPVVVGGASPAAFRRAIEHADGWYGFGLTPEQAEAQIEGLRTAAESLARGRAYVDRLELSVTPRGAPSAAIFEAFAALGVHRLVLAPRSDSSREQIADFVRSASKAAGLT
jgi:probable F420-dependent oxidoreductase